VKVGDLVKHTPRALKSPAVKDLYFGEDSDFKCGLIINEKDSFRLIIPGHGKPSWYQVEELKIISKS